MTTCRTSLLPVAGWIIGGLACVTALAATPASIATTAASVAVKPDPHALLGDYARPTKVPGNKANPTTPEKVALGQQLFFDPRLSGSGAISCASCHNPALSWQDGLAKGIGNMGTHLARHSPTIVDLAWGGPYFWDGRAETLEDQAKGPMTSEKEMAMSVDTALPRLKAIKGYVDEFNKAFPGEGISLDTIAKAMAAYERTVVSSEAPFDRYVAGDEAAISESAKRGFVLFNGKANCAACHVGWRMTDDGFHDIGIADDDHGRAGVVQGIVQLDHAFKTPTLRNVALRAPYMHDGSASTLADVVDHYDHGFVKRASLDGEIHPLELAPSEKADLLAFLDTLTSQDPGVVVPVLPQ